ncbi:MAG: sugar transferase [Devosiaceae bacterium]|nr:sugar transferase [Devosiaceae bacterium]
MGIIITGASGFVGRNIVPAFIKSKEDLLLVGRNREKLQKLFPNTPVVDYDNLAVASKGYDTLVHLAVRNNDRPGDISEFREVNVKHLKAVISSVKAAGIKTIIYATSLHASEKNNSSPYAQSKREAEKLLSKIDDVAIVKLRMPIVYGDTYAGKLKILLGFPAFLRPFLFKILAAFKPTVHVDRLAKAIQNNKNTQESIELVLTDRQKKNWFYATLKRSMDLGFAVFVTIILSWLLAATWVAIKLTSPGPGIFTQQRVGKGGKLFTCYKFRTMHVGTKQVGTHELESNRITKIGNFLRKTKIDELPQIWNIYKNELSLIGPRPCLPVQKELIAQRTKLGVFDIKSGITGWAQIKGVDMSDPKRLSKLDAEYCDLRSIVLDIKILIATMAGQGQGDKVRK